MYVYKSKTKHNLDKIFGNYYLTECISNRIVQIQSDGLESKLKKAGPNHSLSNFEYVIMYRYAGIF